MEYAVTATGPLTVKRFLDKYGHSALTIRAKDPVIEASAQFFNLVHGRKYSIAVVLDENDSVVGVLSLGGIVFAMCRHKENIFNMKASEVMSSPVHSVKLSDDIMSALNFMSKMEIRHVPVIEDGKLLGLVTRKDALEGLYDDQTLELNSLAEFVFRSGARY